MGNSTAASSRTRYALCGLSNRALATFVRPILGTTAGQPSGESTVLGYGADSDDYSGVAELVAVLDTDPERVRTFLAAELPAGHPEVGVFAPDEFEAMLASAEPDVLLVASPDHTHADYLRAGLAHGLSVISEKPMTATAAQAAAVRRAAGDQPDAVRVTHNLRYTPRHRAIKELITSGAIGRVLQVTLDYHVDTRHGSSYFVRWNRERAASGGLSVHKSCHHLDLVDWLIDDLPARVFATGGRNFYGPDGAHRPHDASGQPIGGAELATTDPYYTDPGQVLPAPDGEPRTGSGFPYTQQYSADRPMTIYDREIDIEDTFGALINYHRGASLLYSIDFSSPWEGYTLGITGTGGRIESSYGHLRGEPMPGNDAVWLRPLFDEPKLINVDTGGSGHDGADPVMRRDLFGTPSEESVRLGLVATLDQAAYAVAAGEAIWRSIQTGKVIDVDRLLAE